MIKQSSIILAAGTLGAIVIIFLLATYSAQVFIDSGEIDTTEEPNISILTSDSLHDQSWGSLAYQAQIYIEERHDIEVALYPNITTGTLLNFRIEDEAENGVDLVIGHGREFSEAFSDYADQYPEVSFVSLHGETNHDNHAVYTFNITDAELQAFTAAAVKSETKQIGVITMKDDWKGHEAIVETIEKCKMEIDIHVEEIDSRNDEDLALAALNRLIDEGADVVYSRGNMFNRYVIEQVQKEDIYVIGFMEDQNYMAEQHVLTSVVTNIPLIYDRIMDDFLSEEGIPQGVNVITMDEEVYGITPLGSMFSEKEKEQLVQQFEELPVNLPDRSQNTAVKNSCS